MNLLLLIGWSLESIFMVVAYVIYDLRITGWALLFPLALEDVLFILFALSLFNQVEVSIYMDEENDTDEKLRKKLQIFRAGKYAFILYMIVDSFFMLSGNAVVRVGWYYTDAYAWVNIFFRAISFFLILIVPIYGMQNIF